MAPPPSYQVLLLEPGRQDVPGGGHSARLRATLERHLATLGLEPGSALRVLDEASFPSRDPFLPLATVYFGGPRQDPASTALLAQLRAEGLFILPVVPSLSQYRALVPPVLAPIHGEELRPSDPALEHVAARVLEELRLLRSRRSVFISYKRDESHGVALQLYQALDARSFDVFLDTHSIRRGEDFQPMLWDRLGDADLLLLLDTPHAFTSVWVEQELARAHNLALGLLQLIWPAPHQRTLGTELCEPLLLQPSDFQGPSSDAASTLVPGTVEALVARAEAVRARSLASRRTRVITELCKQAEAEHLEVVVQHTGHLELRHPSHGFTHLFPLVGHPDSALLHELAERCARVGPPSPRGLLVYDPLGIWQRKDSHLRWLNEFLPTRSLPITEVLAWLRTH
ncbi:MAG TPA: toll/interleukin-1 receptor domain-containing protein [Archangium sp.]|uniref:toll/interleukin-1 receptor domain-containing protein n=1 Tax=Archangium sp. TaxID=1872627 RepID=UPI002E349111|nr:toll/interleukin-1 receptor domain-containing protein [Archangium sp.]HEX5753743.1 toll/interleukin-1 receptor domain-containing protein [Archangium sp.]